MVSALTIVCIIFSMVFSLALPLSLLIIIRKKYNAGISVFFVGCAVWFVFAMVLEQILHLAVQLSPLGNILMDNFWMYGIYGGLAAALFEETGRFLAMRFLLKKHYDNPHNALMYGAGHGGFEAFFILGTGMLNNLIYALLINTGNTAMLTAPLNDAQRVQIEAIFQQLGDLPSYMFLISDLERLIAVILHISLSVLVWIAVVKSKKSMLALAYFIHFFVDAAAVIMAKSGVNSLLIEAVLVVFDVVIVFVCFVFWKKYLTNGQKNIKNTETDNI